MSGGLKSFKRIPERGWIAGVCAGIAEYFDWNVKLLRALTVVAVLCTGIFPFVIAYLVLWYAMDPVAPEYYALRRGAAYAHEPPASATAPATMADARARFARLDERLRLIEECVSDKEFELRRELKKLET